MNSKISSKPIRQKLALLETGDLGVEDARQVMKSLLADGIHEDVAVRAYEGLRGWVGHNLQNAGTTAQLRDWYALIEAVAAQFDRELPVWAGRFEVLSDLLQDRIALGASQNVSDVLQRQHVPELLELLSGFAMTPMEREGIKAELALKDANLSRVLRLARNAGLVEKVCRGKEALFAISQIGLQAWETIQARGRSYAPPRFFIVGHSWTEDSQDAEEMSSIQQGGDIREFAKKIEEHDLPQLAA